MENKKQLGMACPQLKTHQAKLLHAVCIALQRYVCQCLALQPIGGLVVSDTLTAPLTCLLQVSLFFSIHVVTLT